MGHDASAHSGADFQIYMQTGWQRGRGGGCNSSILALSLPRSLPVNVSIAETLPRVRVWLTLHLLHLCIRKRPCCLLHLLKQRWRHEGKKGQRAKKKSISRTNASQQKRPMKWLFKHSAVFSTSASQGVENCIENSPVQSWFKYINMSS